MAVQPCQQFSLDSSSEHGFIRFYRSMPEKPSTTVRVFDRTDYYTVHGEDALLAAKEVFHTNSVIKNLGTGESKLQSVLLNRLNFEQFVRDLLLVKQYRVEIYRCKTRGGNDWTVAFKASPGNLQQLEEVVFRGGEVTATCVMAVRVVGGEASQKVVGVAFAEPTERRLGVAEFLDSDQLSNLEALLVQLNPRECVVDGSTEASRLRHTLQRSGVLITEKRKADFSSQDMVQDLNRLLKFEAGATSTMLPQLDLTHAMASLAALIKYLELLGDDSSFGCYQLQTVDISHYLRLDVAAARALNLDPSPGDVRTSHLTGLLNKCRTAQGQRLLGQWVKQPLLDKNKIEERLDVVEVLVSDVQLRQELLEGHLRAMPDLTRLARKLQRGKGTLQDCVRVYQCVQQLPKLTASLREYSGPRSNLISELFISPLTDLVADFVKFVELVEATVDMEMVAQHEYVIRPSFDEELTRLRAEMDEIEVNVNSQFRKTASDLGLEAHKTVKLESNTQLGYFLRVTKKVEKCLRGQKRFTILETRNDGVRFTYSALRSLSEDFVGLRAQYETAQARLAEEVLNVAAGYAEPMQTLSDLLAQLDVFVSFAHVSASAPVPYVRPTITPRGVGDIVLKGARHPCLEMQDDVAFIANDVNLIRGENMFQIITGPNMGGKSTYIRQVGVVVLMAQIGCFVPCSSASISVVDCILARVGAGDSQLRGVSTFMAEMLETASILKSATRDSLVIIDELGRGTSTYDGFGLAWAISEYIATKIGSFCLFATHFHELTALAEVIPTVSNLHVTALTSDDTLTLLYRVKPGVCDQSFGIHVAELAHFPPKVVEFAKQKAAELEVFHSPGGGGEPAAKRLCTDVKEGEQIIVGVLARVRSLLETFEDGEEELKESLQRVREEVLGSGNPYIQSIFSTDSMVSFPDH